MEEKRSPIREWIEAGVDSEDRFNREMAAGAAASQGMNLRVSNHYAENKIREEEIDEFVLRLAKETYGREQEGLDDGPFEARNQQFRSGLEFLVQKMLEEQEP